MESKNENRAESSRLIPKNRAAVIVTPEREVPGISASACAAPIKNAPETERCENATVRARRAPERSASHNKTAKTIDVVATNPIERAFASIIDLNKNPATPAGRVATANLKARRESSFAVRVNSQSKDPVIKLNNSRRRYTITATKVPRCTAISSVNP
jgi:hypothetical protein